MTEHVSLSHPLQLAEGLQFDQIYSRRPLSVKNGIPVFSRSDRYVANYLQISHDHLQAVSQGEGNPNIDDGLWQQMEESTRKLVRKYAQPGSRVLDAGVGLGRLLAPLTDLHRYGVDISPGYLEVARQQGIEVAFSRLEELPYRDGLFDLVIACDVLEHVLDLYKVSAEIVRVLRSGGLLVVRVPYLDDLDAYLNDALPYEFIHLRNFDLAGLRLHFGKIFGMEFVEHSYVAPYLKGHPRMKLRLLHEDTVARVGQLAAANPALDILRRATEVTAEEYMNWLYRLRDEEPLLFGEIAAMLVEPLEINVVFRKR